MELSNTYIKAESSSHASYEVLKSLQGVYTSKSIRPHTGPVTGPGEVTYHEEQIR